MKTSYVAGLAFSLLLSLTLISCHLKNTPTQPSSRISADTIAYAGHGMLFDIHMQEIKLDDTLYDTLQDALLKKVLAEKSLVNNKEVMASIEQARKLVALPQLRSEEKLLLNNLIVWQLLRAAPTELQERYGWRNDVLVSRYISAHPEYRLRLSSEVLDILRNFNLYRFFRDTDYMARCRANQVPIPPDWAETGTQWQLQGTLTHNILRPGEFAAVWTYTDPLQRGACIALPRGSGALGSLAGIICQSATTGSACFWDNRTRSNPDVVLGWSGQRLVIADLVDGSNLGENCTGCHRGNNVFLISPDDPTWRKALRGPLSGPRPLTFTTQVEVSSDNTGGHPRYIPLTTTPARSGWTNPFASGGCAGACHERPVVSPVSVMPPTCAAGVGLAGCYGTP